MQFQKFYLVQFDSVNRGHYTQSKDGVEIEGQDITRSLRFEWRIILFGRRWIGGCYNLKVVVALAHKAIWLKLE